MSHKDNLLGDAWSCIYSFYQMLFATCVLFQVWQNEADSLHGNSMPRKGAENVGC